MFSFVSMILIMGSFHLNCFASIGNSSGGGGEEEEIKISDIREDISNWIKKGGAEKLDLQGKITYFEYKEKMLEILRPKNVIIGFVENDQSNDEELKVSVNNIPKTCRGFISKKNNKPHIICNLERFKSTSETGKYKLIHHEFAGLSNLEKNLDAASDYFISSQITDYLEWQTVLKLSIKKQNKESGYLPDNLFGKYPAKYHCYELSGADVKCVVPTNEELDEIINAYKKDILKKQSILFKILNENNFNKEYKAKILKIAEDTRKEIGPNLLSNIYISYFKNYDQSFKELVFSESDYSFEKLSKNISNDSDYLKQLLMLKEVLLKNPSEKNYYNFINNYAFTSAAYHFTESLKFFERKFEMIRPSFDFKDFIKLGTSCSKVKGKGRHVRTSIFLPILNLSQTPESGFDPVLDFDLLKEFLTSNHLNQISIECKEVELSKNDLSYQSKTLLPKYDSKNKSLLIPYYIHREFSTNDYEFDYTYKKAIIYYNQGYFLEELRKQFKN